MSWQDVRGWYEERDDDEATPEPPTRYVCEVCGRILADPPGAKQEETVEDCSEACAVKRQEWEEQRQQDYDAAMVAIWETEAEHQRTHCQWCGREAEPATLTANSGVCPECVGAMDHTAAEAVQDGDSYSSNAIPW